jgi:methyl-accepting chemotaxis protein
VAEGEELSDADRDRILSEKLWAELGAIRESVAVIPAMREDISILRTDVDEIKSIQIVHGVILKEHSEILREHSAILGQHSEDLTEIKATLQEHSETLQEHSADLTEIKHSVAGLQAASHTH